MSKATPPSPNSDPDPLDVKANRGFPLDAGQGGDSRAQTTSETTSEDLWDWQTIDFPSALSVDGIARSSAGNPADSSLEDEPPQVAELVTLIQELNECNDTLLDRVAQLEAALEQSQTALQLQVKRSQMNVEPQVLAAAQEQVTQLLNQLEFSHQASQRQQILAETLTEQLESSQERVAQLERECSAIQQRCNEQSQQLMESENACRDLRTRLQRQQRYTLQFKVALDKCLEVQPPRYEGAGEATSAGWNESVINVSQPFLPKAAKIQPWSSHPQFPGGMQSEVPNSEAPSAIDSSERLNRISLPDALPQPDDIRPTASEWLSSDERVLPGTDAAIDASSKPSEDIQEAVRVAVQDEGEGEAIESLPFAQPAAAQVPQPSLAVGEAASPAAAEDNMWQDLARLIDVSTDDVIRAKSAQDFTEFAVQPSPENDLTDDLWGNFPQLPQPAELPDAAAIDDTGINDSTISPIELRRDGSIESDPKPKLKLPGVMLDAPANSPSPVVYPLRPKRKLQSLAAVDLPTFPR